MLLPYERRLQHVWSVLISLFRSRVSLEAEILILRHQPNIQRRHQPKRLAFSAMEPILDLPYHTGCEADIMSKSPNTLSD